MATKPTDAYEWATDAAYDADAAANKIVPPSVLRANGWERGEEPGAQHVNHLLNAHGQWHEWAEDSIDALETDVTAIEARIVSDEWRYPAFKVRTIEFMPNAFEQVGDTANNIPWRFRPAVGNAQTAKTAGTERAEVALQLNRLIPGNGVVTAIWVMVTPGAARTGGDKLGAVLYSREPSVYTPGSEAIGAVAVVQSVADDGGTGMQAMLLNSGADMTLGYAIWLNVFSGSGDTTNDLFHGIKIAYQDVGPINT